MPQRLNSLHRLTPRLLALYGAVWLLLAALGAWLVSDFLQERQRLEDAVARMALQKSQLISRAFGDSFTVIDYVLRDVVGHVEFESGFTPSGWPQAQSLDSLLQAKADSVSGLTDLVLLDARCNFVAVARKPLLGTRSNQKFCSKERLPAGQSLHIQYMPPEQSASQRAVLLMSRVLASEQGQLLGAAMAVIDLEHAQNWLAVFETSGNDVLVLVDTQATLLARIPPMPQALGQRSSLVAGQPPLAAIGAGVTFAGISPIDKQVRLFGMSGMENVPFVAIVGVERDRVLQSWQHRAWQFAAGYLGLTVLAWLALRAHVRMLRQREVLRSLATTDALTGLANRRSLIERGEHEYERALRYQRPLAVLMLDIDHFKSINDRWGHASGDAVIGQVADKLVAQVREQDCVGRLGGEEFAVLLPETSVEGARIMAERMRLAIAALEVQAVGSAAPALTPAADASAAPTGAAATTSEQTLTPALLHCTVSIGVASLGAQDASFDVLLQRADQALYRAKAEGRNRVQL